MTFLQQHKHIHHLQVDGKPLFVSFSTFKRWTLPSKARELVLEHCLRENDKRIYLHTVVVMPDHVHILCVPLRDSEGCSYRLSKIMNSIKGASAHSINKLLNRRGRVWEQGYFDHLIRTESELISKSSYIIKNPISRGLTKEGEIYPWLWRSWVEGGMSQFIFLDS
jgi:putative transposase